MFLCFFKASFRKKAIQYGVSQPLAPKNTITAATATNSNILSRAAGETAPTVVTTKSAGPIEPPARETPAAPVPPADPPTNNNNGSDPLYGPAIAWAGHVSGPAEVMILMAIHHRM